MRARIELTGCLTHTARRPCVKGRPFYTTSASEIAYFQSQGVFAVTVLEGKPPKAKAELKPPAPSKEVEVVEEECDDNDLTVVSYTKTDLEATKKADLQALAADEFELDLDPDRMSKKVMVAAILKAQIERLEASEEE